MISKEERPLRTAITHRLNNLSGAYWALARKSRTYTILAAISKVLLIILGAFIAAGDTVAGLLGPYNIPVHTIASILVAIIAGLDAAFQPARRAERQNILAMQCRNKKRQLESLLIKIDTITVDDTATAKELELLDNLDQYSQEFHEQAAALNVNVILELPSLSSKIAK